LSALNGIIIFLIVIDVVLVFSLMHQNIPCLIHMQSNQIKDCDMLLQYFQNQDVCQVFCHLLLHNSLKAIRKEI